MPPWLSRRQQAQRWSVTKRTVERWGEDKKVGLPQEYEVNGRKYRDLPEIEIWERSRAVLRCRQPSSAQQQVRQN